MVARIYVDQVHVTPPDPEPWMDDAACLDADIDIFFPSKGETVKAAKEICSGCEVKIQCLAFALRMEPVGGRRIGVYGGTSPKERHALYDTLIRRKV